MPDDSSIAEAPPVAPRPRHGQTLRLLAALVLAIAGGLLARRIGPHGIAAAQSVGQLGQLWLNALRMTLIPLIFCLMTTGIASIARTAAGGKVARISLTVFITLLVLGSILGVLSELGLTTLWPVAALQSVPAAASSTAPPSLLAEFVALLPANPIASAAEGAMAPLLIFAAIFGIAIVRLASAQTTQLLEFFNAVAAAMLVIIGWVLRLAPIGIFCLLFATIATVGSDAAKGLFQYAVISSLVCAVGLVIAQLVGMFAGAKPGAGPIRFAHAAFPAQTLAATTQSSTACLPALLESAATLQLPPAIVAAITPLAVATFRFGNVFTAVASGIIGANLFGIHPTPAKIIAAIGIGVLTNIGSVGVPGAAVLFAAWGPIYLALGAPLEALTLYVAIITLPDILMTTTNVTADLAATSLIARYSKTP